MKALVLCGGKGTRLRPLTYTLPKQLIPIANRPVVHYVMDHLRDAGIRDVGVIVAPETADQVRLALEGNPWQVSFTFLVQDAPRGLAHAVLVAREFLGDDSFVMYLGDNLLGTGLAPLLQVFTHQSADAVVLLKEVDDPRRFGVAEVDGQGRLRRLVEKPDSPPSNLALVGVYVFGPAIHEAVSSIQPSRRGELEITDAIQWLLDRGRRVWGERLESWWLDCGKKDDLLEANRVVLDAWARFSVDGDVDADSRILGRVQVSRGAQVRRSTIRGPAAIGAGAVVDDAFIGPFTSVGERCVVRSSSLEHCVVLDGAQVEGVERMEDSVVGRNARVRRLGGTFRALRLMVGDEAEVLL
jgi:glucose-1-phosphate thymidylyltransferase